MTDGALTFSCDCGKIEGQLHNAPAKGIHLVCYCDSCRAAAIHAGDAPAEGAPVDLYLTQPEHITLSKGTEHLRAIAFSPNGIVRWQAGCCKGQLFSTQPSPKTAFMSLCIDRLAQPEAVGPVVSKAFVPQGNGKTRHEGKGALVRLVLGSLRARFTGRWRKTPLFDVETLQPVQPITVLAKGEKEALLS